MAELVYLLCALTSVVCAVLLLRSYRETRTRLLFWGSLCFVGLVLSNVVLVVDLMLVPDIDFSTIRSVLSFSAVAVFVFGLVWESK